MSNLTRHTNEGETFTLCAVVAESGRPGLVRLAGDDPTRATDA